MAGRGFLEEAPELDSSRIYILRNGRWQKMFRPITPDRSFAGVSLAEKLYPLYEQKFQKIMTAFKKELNLYNVPFLLGGLGDYLKDRTCNPEMAKNYVHVNEALKQIATNNEMTGFVSAEGLMGNPDNLHFNSVSLYEFGERYFDEYEELSEHNKLFEKK